VHKETLAQQAQLVLVVLLVRLVLTEQQVQLVHLSLAHKDQQDLQVHLVDLLVQRERLVQQVFKVLLVHKVFVVKLVQQVRQVLLQQLQVLLVHKVLQVQQVLHQT
jgi:hypothetical protein